MIKASIYKPITMLMVILTVVVFGIYTYRMLPVNLLPDFEVPVVTAVVIYTGANPDELVSTVIKPTEEQLELLDGIDYVMAYALENYAIFIAMFEMDVNIDVAANDMRDKIEQTAINFPDAVEDPVISKVDINGQAIIELALTGPGTSTELRTRADDLLKPQISSLPGVASVDLFGGTIRQVLVELDADALQERNISITTVMGLIQASNLNYPGGEVKGKNKNTNVRVSAKYADLEDLRNMEIPTAQGMIRLSDVAAIKDTIEEISSASRFNGVNSVGLSIKKRTDANTIDVVDGVLQRLEKINALLPEGYKLSVVYDSSKVIRNSVNNVITNLLLAIVLTSGILLLFLGRFSSMFIAAITMPISVIGSFTFMYFAGFTINVMTLMALSSATGLLVTNAIIVLENIDKFLAEGLSPKEAAFKGTTEIMLAVMSSTLTNVCVFVPIAFMKSIAGSMFKSFGLTMVFATFVSLLITFTLTPLMAAYMFKARKRDANGELIPEKKSILGKFFGIFPMLLALVQKAYMGTLKFCLSKFGFVVQMGALVALLLFTYTLATKFLSVEMMPKTDEGVIVVTLELPVGTNLDKTDAVIKDMENRVKDIPELEKYYISIGGEQGLTTVNQGSLRITLVDRESRTRSTDQIVDSLRMVFSNIPGAYLSIKSTSASNMQGGSRGDVTLEVLGTNLDSVVRAAELAMDKIADVNGVIELKSSYEAGKPEIAFTPNRKAIADYGMTLQEAATTAYMYITGYEASRYMDPIDDEEYDIFIRLREADRNTLEKIRNLPILTPKGYLPITALFEAESFMAPTKLLRKSKNYVIQISMNLLPGFTSGQIMSEVTKVTQAIENVPEGVTFGFGGNADMQKEMVEEFIVAILMAILLVYILLVALLESFAQPFIIMTTIPMGAIGVVMALAITGKSLSIIAFFAIVMLIGVVVNNAILLLDEANRLLRSGTMGRRSAILNAANNKFTPIVLATVASIAAQVPLALGLGEGAETTQPMGIASIGGLLISAILTMYLIPTFFWLPNALFSKVKKTVKKK